MAWQAPAVPDLVTPQGMGRERFDAMGTVVSVLTPTAMLLRATTVVKTLFSDWEGALTRFRPDSELSFVNARAGLPTPVSPLFWRVLSAAIDAARATAGTFDPTLGRQIVENGYDRTFKDVPAQRPSLHPAPSPGGAWRSVRLDPATHTVTLSPSVHLDFGGIAKGLAVDAAIVALESAGLTPVLVEAGGDMRVSGSPAPEAGWSVAVEILRGTETITLFSGGLATSSRLRRFWRAADKEMHHILDPRTGLPAGADLCSVTVAAATCVQADVAAKAAFIHGSSAGRGFLEGHGLSGLLVKDDGTVIRAGRWPAQQGAA